MTGAELATAGDVQRLEAKLDRLLAVVAELQPPRFIPVREACQLLGNIDRATLRRLIDRNELVAQKAGRRWLVELASVRRMAEARR